jgi:putative transposase
VNLYQDRQFPQRQSPSPGVYIQLGQSNIVLLTINAENRRPWLDNDTAHQLLHQTWSEATAWLVGDYLLMPDHLHLFCAPRDLNFTMETWIAYWKREFSFKHGLRDWKFQSRGWHHRLQDGENYSEKWIYVQENPIRKGLIQSVEDWPFKGRVFDLMWSGK